MIILISINCKSMRKTFLVNNIQPLISDYDALLGFTCRVTRDVCNDSFH